MLLLALFDWCRVRRLEPDEDRPPVIADALAHAETLAARIGRGEVRVTEDYLEF